MGKKDFLVYISCSTYNHAPYIEEALNGFCMQKTTFPFVCTIIDDASTDGEPEVIKKYLQEHFDLEEKSILRNEETDDYILTFARHKENINCFFAVVYLKYNHYSIRKPRLPYVAEWINNCRYIALCEGDDYWIDPMKLQKQVDFLESHNDYVMVCNRTYLYSNSKQKYVGENFCYDSSRDLNPKDVIRRGGLFISTCSVLYRRTLIENRPDYWIKCGVGDYPLQIACVLYGKAYYFNEIMSVYRIDNTASWVGTQQMNSISKKRLAMIKSVVEMFHGFANDFPEYKSVFLSKIADQINRNIPSWKASRKEKCYYYNFFCDEIRSYSIKWKIDYWIRRAKIPKLKNYYMKIFMKKYSQRKLLY